MAAPIDPSDSSISNYSSGENIDSQLIDMVRKVSLLDQCCADFHLFIISPTIDALASSKNRGPATEPSSTQEKRSNIIEPALIQGTNEYEFVYPIHDYGFKLSTSKGSDMHLAGLSMCKLYYTIEKIVDILIGRLQEAGVEKDTEVEIAFAGNQLAQRKCFDSIINLSYNVVVTNFDPGIWGERYLATTKLMADLGYGYPPESPRDIYRKSYGNLSKSKP